MVTMETKLKCQLTEPADGSTLLVTMELSLCMISQRGLCGYHGNKIKMSINRTSRWQHTLGYNRDWFVHDIRGWFLGFYGYCVLVQLHVNIMVDPRMLGMRVVINIK